MTIFEDMEAKKKAFTKTDNQIYAMIKKFPDDVAANRINDIVETFQISQPALTRFAKKMGFSGFTEFQFAYKKDLQSVKDTTEHTRARQYGELFTSIENAISKETIHELAEHLLHAHIVYTTGASIARLPAGYIFSIAQISRYFTAIECSPHELPAPMRNDDVLILFSAYSGHAFKYSLERINEKETKPYKVLFTFNPKHPLRKDFDMVILIPTLYAPGTGSAVTAETISFLFVIDCLIDEISTIKNAQEE